MPLRNFQVWCHEGCSLSNVAIKFFATISTKEVRIDQRALVLSSTRIFCCTWRTSLRWTGQVNPWPSGWICTSCLASKSSKIQSILQCSSISLLKKAAGDVSPSNLPVSLMSYSFHRVDFLCSEVVDEIDLTKGSTSYLWTYCVFAANLSLPEFHCWFLNYNRQIIRNFFHLDGNQKKLNKRSLSLA